MVASNEFCPWLTRFQVVEVVPLKTMIEIKVQCDCGQKYKFDVEPANGRMPYHVTCPVCGLDGTKKANALLSAPAPVAIAAVPLPAIDVPALPSVAAAPSPQPPAPAPIRISMGVPSPAAPAGVVAPPAPAAVATAAPVAAVPEQPRLRIGGFAHPAASSPGAVAPPPPVSSAPRAIPAMAVPSKGISAPAEKSNLFLGIGGAVGAGTIAMIAWYFLIKITGYEIGYAAWGVGLLTGIGARALGRSGSTLLGVVAGLCAFLAITGGQFLYAKSEVDKSMDEMAQEAFNSRMEYAQAAQNVQTDDQIKALLMKHEFDGEQPTAEDVKTFRETELPQLKEFAGGKPSKAEFEKDFKKIKDTFVYKILLFKESVGLFTLLWVVLGVSSAYKLGSR